MHSRFALALAALALVAPAAQAQSSSPTERLRGTVQSFDGRTLVLVERSNATHTLALADNFVVTEVVPTAPAQVQAGSYVGIASAPGADGRLRAIEVLVFPETARGTGEGHGPWDLLPGSTMTNAAVAGIVVAGGGRTLTLRYKDGEQTIVVPDDVPVVTVKPGDRGLLVPGARVFVVAQTRDGKPTALRAIAGRDGFAPPM